MLCCKRDFLLHQNTFSWLLTRYFQFFTNSENASSENWQNYHFCEPSFVNQKVNKTVCLQSPVAFKQVGDGCYCNVLSWFPVFKAILIKLCNLINNWLQKSRVPDTHSYTAGDRDIARNSFAIEHQLYLACTESHAPYIAFLSHIIGHRSSIPWGVSFRFWFHSRLRPRRTL